VNIGASRKNQISKADPQKACGFQYGSRKRGYMRPFLAILCVLLLAGCAEHRLIVPKPNPGTAPVTVNSAAIGWGASQTRNVADCQSNLIDEVRVKQNVGQALLSVLTLGFYMPTTIEYTCAKTPSVISDGGDD
jgi:Bor protein